VKYTLGVSGAGFEALDLNQKDWKKDIMRDHMHLMRSKRFLPLFITQFFGAFNDNAFKNAFLIWFTYDVATNSGINAPMMVTLAAGLFILPFFLFSATAGQFADKYERSYFTRKIKFVEVILMLAVSAGFFLGSIYGLLVVLFMMGVQSTFFGPIKYSLLPEHLNDDELIGGNGLIEGGTFLSILFGTIFGGLIIGTTYGKEMLALALVGFALVGWISSRSIPLAPVGDPNLKIGWNIFRETWKIIGYAQEERTVWLSIIGISWFWFVGAMFLTQFPVFTKQTIGGNEHIVTLFLTIFSVGIGIGSVWCNKLLKGEINGRLVPYGSVGMTVAIAVFVAASLQYSADRIVYLEQVLNYQDRILGLTEFFSVSPASWGIIGGLLALSVCAGIYIVPLYTIMQHRSDDKYLARIIAAANVINALFMVMASVVALLLFSLSFSSIQILLAVGVLNIPVFFLVRGIVRRRLNVA
jgi:acyl-[acyl-carrier-protein]-phospholipid O-acyltransferase/long-chain-fatty-acid--[acyl-carrier-protein] ligase